VKVKICGVTSVADARQAALAGADAIGLNFYRRSKRCVSVATARAIVEALPPLVWAVGVFVDEPLASLRRIAREVGLHALQLHGHEPAAFAARLALPTFKALHVAQAPPDASGFERVQALVLDAAQPGFGGGGLAFDWKLARAIARQRPVLLAGGLTPKNVAAAIRAVRPWGVDVASGVEAAPGIKDPRKVAAFIRAARSTT
jgi:phosphoribosylanthranilate isomerase